MSHTPMSSRALKELKSLAPWQWDARVNQHPPGAKALSDFEKVEQALVNAEPGQARTRQSIDSMPSANKESFGLQNTPSIHAPRRRSSGAPSVSKAGYTPSSGRTKDHLEGPDTVRTNLKRKACSNGIVADSGVRARPFCPPVSPAMQPPAAMPLQAYTCNMTSTTAHPSLAGPSPAQGDTSVAGLPCYASPHTSTVSVYLPAAPHCTPEQASMGMHQPPGSEAVALLEVGSDNASACLKAGSQSTAVQNGHEVLPTAAMGPASSSQSKMVAALQGSTNTVLGSSSVTHKLAAEQFTEAVHTAYQAPGNVILPSTYRLAAACSSRGLADASCRLDATQVQGPQHTMQGKQKPAAASQAHALNHSSSGIPAVLPAGQPCSQADEDVVMAEVHFSLQPMDAAGKQQEVPGTSPSWSSGLLPLPAAATAAITAALQQQPNPPSDVYKQPSQTALHAAVAPAQPPSVSQPANAALTPAQLVVMNRLLEYFEASGHKTLGHMSAQEMVQGITGFCKAMGMPPSAANMQALATWLATLLAMQPTAMQQLLQSHQPQQATPPTQVVEHAQPSDMPAHGGMTSTHAPAPAAAAAAAEMPLTAACSAGQPSLSAATRTAGMGAAPAPCVAPSVSSRHFADVASMLVPLQLSAPPASFLRLPNTVRPPLEPVLLGESNVSTASKGQGVPALAILPLGTVLRPTPMAVFETEWNSMLHEPVVWLSQQLQHSQRMLEQMQEHTRAAAARDSQPAPPTAVASLAPAQIPAASDVGQRGTDAKLHRPALFTMGPSVLVAPPMHAAHGMPPHAGRGPVANGRRPSGPTDVMQAYAPCTQPMAGQQLQYNVGLAIPKHDAGPLVLQCQPAGVHRPVPQRMPHGRAVGAAGSRPGTSAAAPRSSRVPKQQAKGVPHAQGLPLQVAMLPKDPRLQVASASLIKHPSFDMYAHAAHASGNALSLSPTPFPGFHTRPPPSSGTTPIQTPLLGAVPPLCTNSPQPAGSRPITPTVTLLPQQAACKQPKQTHMTAAAAKPVATADSHLRALVEVSNDAGISMARVGAGPQAHAPNTVRAVVAGAWN